MCGVWWVVGWVRWVGLSWAGFVELSSVGWVPESGVRGHQEIVLFRSHLNRNILSRSHPKSNHANIEISVISRYYHGNCYRENIKLPITVPVTHVHY